MSIYVGPYIKINNAISTETVIEKKLRCSNTSCENYISPVNGKYCNKCGHKTETFDFITTFNTTEDFAKKVAFILYQTLGSESLSPISIDDILICNIKKDYILILDINDIGIISTPNKTKSIQSFISDFKSELDLITKKGFNYKIDFGVIQY